MNGDYAPFLKNTLVNVLQTLIYKSSYVLIQIYVCFFNLWEVLFVY